VVLIGVRAVRDYVVNDDRLGVPRESEAAPLFAPRDAPPA
jgi:hypothetical protein